MRIREMRASDLPRLKELQGEYEWDTARGFMRGLVVVDEHDVAQMFAGAWTLAEVHVACNPKFGTPGERMAAFTNLHNAMELEMYRKGVNSVVTWFEGNERSFLRRLTGMGWAKSLRECWVRRIHG